MQSILLELLAEEFAATVEEGIVEPDLITGQETIGVKVTVPEDAVALLWQFFWDHSAAEKLVEGSETEAIVGCTKMLDQTLDENERREFQAANPGDRNPVSAVEHPKVFDGSDRINPGGHHEPVVDQNPVGRIPYLGRLIRGPDHPAGEGGPNNLEANLSLAVTDGCVAEDLGGPGEDGDAGPGQRQIQL
jgi:hypothetical protein